MISIERTTDSDLIKSVITKPCIWDRAAQDFYKTEDYAPNESDLWLKLTVNNEIAGVYAFDNLTGVACNIHPYVLPEFRIKAAKDGLSKALGYLFENFSRVNKVNAEIPVIYRAVYNFAIKNGFTHEGVNRQSFLKNNTIHDQYLVGITRLEYEHN